MQTQPYSFPITLTVSRATIKSHLFLLARLGILSFFVMFVLLFYARASIMLGELLFLTIFILFHFLDFLVIFNKKIILSEQGVVYKTLTSTHIFSYKDIEKVGYYYLFQPGGYGLSETMAIDVYLHNKTKPIRMHLMQPFSIEHVLLFLDILTRYANQALFGEKVLSIIATKVYPVKKRSFIVFFPTTIEDSHFVHGDTIAVK